jgi:hypothetical protein
VLVVAALIVVRVHRAQKPDRASMVSGAPPDRCAWPTSRLTATVVSSIDSRRSMTVSAAHHARKLNGGRDSVACGLGRERLEHTPDRSGVTRQILRARMHATAGGKQNDLWAAELNGYWQR